MNEEGGMGESIMCDSIEPTWKGPSWKCEALLDTGFLVILEHTDRIDGKRVARRYARIGCESIVWDFMKWLRDVLELDTDIVVEFPGLDKRYVI